jgi:hypothetical protein
MGEMNNDQTATRQIEIPIALLHQAQKLVEAGWFRNLDELFGEGLRRFLESHRADLMEEFVRQDWVRVLLQGFLACGSK